MRPRPANVSLIHRRCPGPSAARDRETNPTTKPAPLTFRSMSVVWLGSSRTYSSLRSCGELERAPVLVELRQQPIEVGARELPLERLGGLLGGGGGRGGAAAARRRPGRRNRSAAGLCVGQPRSRSPPG